MKYLISIIFITQIYHTISPIPNWDLTTQAIDLFPSGIERSDYRFTIYENTAFDTYVKLEKWALKTDEGYTYKNYLYVNSYGAREVPFENIDSHYKGKYGKNILICPGGKFHPYDYDNNEYINPPNDFASNDYWDLRCYNHVQGYFLVFYLLNGNSILYFMKNSGITKVSWITNLYDFRLQNETRNHNEKNKFARLILENDKLKLYYNGLIMNTKPEENFVNMEEVGDKDITDAKTYIQAYFNHLYYFYFFTYNTIYDFTSGGSDIHVKMDNDDTFKINNIGFYVNSRSPLSFVDNIEINEIKFINDTSYVYYNFNNTNTGKKLVGIIDVATNRVIYNLQDDVKAFIPISTSEMLLITQTSAYKVCIIKNTNGGTESCSNTCTGNNLLLDPDQNKCQTNCDTGKVKMMPEQICLNKSLCDLNYYIFNENETECGLCDYFYSDTAKYRFVGNDKLQCLDTIPSHATFYNEYLNLLKCEENYHFENYQCLPDYCYERCKNCSEVSSDINSQKCTECKSGYSLEEGNCVIPPTTALTTKESTSGPSTSAITTNIPTTKTEAPTTIITDAPTTIITDAPTTIITEAPTTIITEAPTTIITEKPSTVPIVCPDEKCLTCNEESNELGLCLSCNEALGYIKVNYTLVLTNFLDCMKPNNPKSKKFYYNENLTEYRPCYKTCKQCLREGNPEANYCLECETDYMFRPGNNPYNNCVAYSEYYYISGYNQYKSLKIYQCPEEAKYYIRNKKSCIDDCQKDAEYKYLYNGNCLKECPEGTINNNYICKLNYDKCTLGKNDLYLSYQDNLEVIETLVKSYISEFYYTDNYISLYQNVNYSIIIYKKGQCITDLNLELPNVDFQSCYTKVQTKYELTNQYLIIVIVDRKEINNAKTFYSFYHPLSGMKLDANEVCKDETIVVKESLTSVLDKNDTNKYEAQTSLTSQGINIFDLNDPFYTDICYDFDNPMTKDIPLNDRIKTLYPDVELCGDGCQIKGINLEDMKSTCDCTFNDIAENSLIKDNPLAESSIGQIFDLINSSNILVLKCFKNIFTHFSRSIGGWICLTLIACQIGLSLTFFLMQITQPSKYIFNLTKDYIRNLSKNEINSPPKKKKGISNENKRVKIKSQVNSDTDLKNKTSKKPIIKDAISEKNSTGNLIELYQSNKKVQKVTENLEIKTEHNLTTKEGEEIYDKNFFQDYMETSPEDMEFDDAVAKDKRKYCEHMKENLIEDQLITAAFIAEDPLKPRTIKIMVFILNLILYFVVNGLFFSESVISELYNVDESKENFFSFLPRSIDKIFYTALVGVAINIITGFFFVEENKLKGILRREKDNIKVLKEKVKEFRNDLKRRYIAFICVVSFILVISFFYLLCFNYVYPYTQIEWIKSSITIFIIMQLLSLLKCILETSLRFLSYKFNSEKLYKISKFLN